jgi:hypothetical protein
MLKNGPKSLSSLLATKDGSLGNLTRKARLREDLSDHLRKQLPSTLSAGFLHCNLREQGLLIVLASSPEWASRLRFETELIRRLCAAHGTEVSSVKVRVG